MEKGAVGSPVPLFSCHNLLGSSALPQPERADTHLEVLYYFGFEDLRGSLNARILWNVNSSSAFVFHVRKLNFGVCSQVIIPILCLILLTLLSSSLGDFPQLLWNDFLPQNPSAGSKVSTPCRLPYTPGVLL